MSVFGKLKQAASKLGEMVGIEQHQAGGEVDPLDEARTRVQTLRSNMESMKGTLVSYSRSMCAAAAQTRELAQEWQGLYSNSAARSNSLQTFATNQAHIERCGLSLYKDTFGWDVLKVFDDFDGDVVRILADIDKTAKARDQVAKEEDQVKSLRGQKERRIRRNEPVDRKEEQQLENIEAMFEKHSVLFSNMRLNLDKSLAAFFDQRFQTLDRAFVRFMEIQLEFFQEGITATTHYRPIIEGYRKRFPRKDSGRNEYGPTPDAQSPLPQPSPPANGTHTDEPAAAVPTRSMSPPQEPTQHSPQRRPPSQKPPAPKNANESGTDTDTETSDVTDSSDDDSGPSRNKREPSPPAAAATAAPAKPKAAAEPVIDLFNFPAEVTPTPARSAEPAKPKPSPDAEEQLSDFFGGAASSAPKKPSHASGKSSGGVFEDFDFSGGGAGGAGGSSSHLSAPAGKLPQSVSSPALQNQRGLPPKPADPLHAFDPFASSPHAQAAAAASSRAAPPKARSASPPPSAPGTSHSGMVGAFLPPTHKLDEHIEAQAAAKVAALREAEQAQEAHFEARREAEQSLEAQLANWEFNKDGGKKNVRNLLASVHTVLWPNSGWKPIGIADLIDFNAIKKAHMKVIRVVHPDKLTNATPEHMVIALRVFDVLNQAFERFKETGQ